MLERYREEAWFRLGDRDFATHIARTSQLRSGRTLTEAVIALQRALGIASTILPMADEPVRTQLRTDDGWLEFQEYFVHRHQAPEVLEVRHDGIEAARPTAQVRAALGEADVIVIGPSNPIVSLGPILAVPAVKELLGRARVRGVPVVAVSAIVGGKALKGPADRMLTSARPRGERRRCRRDPRAVDRRLRARSGRRGARARDRRARAADPRHGHDHGRRRGSARLAEAVLTSRPAAGRGRVGTIGGVTGRIRHRAPAIAAIIPVGTLEGAKTRLGGSLDAEERHDLVTGLLARTVAAALAVERLADVLVVSPDREVLRRAADLGARTLRQRIQRPQRRSARGA